MTVQFGGYRRGALVCSASLFVLFFVQLQPALAQQLYAYRSPRGVVTFTSSRPSSQKDFWEVKPRAPSYSTFVHGGEGSYRWVGYPVASKYDDLIIQLARSYQLEPALVKAVMHCESAFNPSARSHKGATGLMQLMPDTARRFGVHNIYNPVENVTGGVRYLKWLFRHFDGNIHHVLAGYNAGENAVTRYAGIPPYAETRDYVRRVLKMRDLYRRDYSGQASS
ncbi:MAG TPA: lytic transglycosylase domain-containing protein [Oligoflexia bacterium]|nr:lytic transglycosylase domain-containing protein [Oligoflexia bacterium]